MSRTKKKVPDVHKEMAEVFKRKSGPQLRPKSRSRERLQWEKEFEQEQAELHKEFMQLLHDIDLF